MARAWHTEDHNSPCLLCEIPVATLFMYQIWLAAFFLCNVLTLSNCVLIYTGISSNKIVSIMFSHGINVYLLTY